MTENENIRQNLIEFYKENGSLTCNIEAFNFTQDPKIPRNVQAFEWASELAVELNSTSLVYTYKDGIVISIEIRK